MTGDSSPHSEPKADGESWEDYAHRLEVRIKNQRDQLEEVQKHMDEPTRRARSRINALERALGIKALKMQGLYDGLEAVKTERDGLVEQVETLRRGAEWEQEHGGCFCRPCNELVGNSNPASEPKEA